MGRILSASPGRLCRLSVPLLTHYNCVILDTLGIRCLCFLICEMDELLQKVLKKNECIVTQDSPWYYNIIIISKAGVTLYHVSYDLTRKCYLIESLHCMAPV